MEDNNNVEVLDVKKEETVEEKNDTTVDTNTVNFSVVKAYGEDLTAKTYVTNPAIAREDEIKKLMIVLLTPDKSGLLIGKAGIGKTAIVEGLAYKIQRNDVPESLKGYRIIKINSTSLLGKISKDGKEEMAISILVRELKGMSKVILFIDEVHTLIGGASDGPMDLANILKPALDRGDVKAIGATTTEEYETYVIRDRAFLRRFDRIDVLEPDHATTVKILVGTIPRIAAKTGAKFKYTDFVVEELMDAIVGATSEYKRVYGLAAMYPDVALSVLSQSFSNALFENRTEVNVLDVYNAIKNSKRIYPDAIIKELRAFKTRFSRIAADDNIVLPDVTIDDIKVEA